MYFYTSRQMIISRFMAYKKIILKKKKFRTSTKKNQKKKSNTKRANVLVEQCSRPSKVSTKNITSIHDNIYFVVSYFLFCHLISSKMNIFVYAIIPHIFSFWMQTFLFLAQSRQLTCILYCYECLASIVIGGRKCIRNRYGVKYYSITSKKESISWKIFT